MEKEGKNTAIYVAYDEFRPLDPAEPEKSLLLAILMTAIQDLRKNGNSAQKAAEFFLDPDEMYIFSFRSICTHLDIDCKKVLRFAGIMPELSHEYEVPVTESEQEILSRLDLVN